MLAAGAFRGWLPTWLIPWSAGPLLLCGAGLPVLLRWTPHEPSSIKLVLASSLLSPCILSALLWPLRALLPLDTALAVAMASCALLQPLAFRNRVRFDPIGKAAGFALALALLVAVVAACSTLGAGVAARILPQGAVWHAGVVQSLARSFPAEHPWLAATPLPSHPGFDGLVLLFARALATAPTRAAALVGVWSAAIAPVALYLLAAPLWREPRRVACAPLLALFGWNALGGLIAGWVSPEGGTVPVELARATPGAGPGQVLYGLAGFIAPGPFAASSAYALAAWMSAAHALRHAGRPWVGLCAIFHGAAFCLEPVLGGVAAVPTLVVALIHPGTPAVRSRVPLALATCALPGLSLLARFGAAGEPVRPFPGAAGPMAVLGPAALLVAASLGLLSRRWQAADPAADVRGRRTILSLCILASAVALAAPALVPGSGRHTAELARLGSFPLGVLAAGGLIDLVGGRRTRLPGVALAGALALGALFATALALRAQYALGQIALPLSDDGGGFEMVAPEGGADEDLATVLRSLRMRGDLHRRRALLVCGADERGPGGNFAPHMASLYADLPMWCDRVPELAPAEPAWRRRHDWWHGLYGTLTDWDPRLIHELSALGRPVVFVVEEADRLRTHRGERDKPRRGVDLRLQRLGCERIEERSEVAVYLWDPERVPEDGSRAETRR